MLIQSAKQSFFSVCSYGAATPPWNQMLCGGKRDHLRTCIPGSCRRCATWSGWLHRCTVGCRYNHTDGDWLHIGQRLSGNGSECTTPSGHVGIRHWNSWVIDDLGVSWKISLPSSSPEVFCGRWTILAGGMANETLDG